MPSGAGARRRDGYFSFPRVRDAALPGVRDGVLRFRGCPASVARMADWTFKEARENLGVSEAHLRNLVRKRLIPCYWVGDLVRFQPQRIDAWKAAGGTRSAAGPEAGEARSASAPDGRRAAGGPAGEVGSSKAWLALVAEPGEREES